MFCDDDYLKLVTDSTHSDFPELYIVDKPLKKSEDSIIELKVFLLLLLYISCIIAIFVLLSIIRMWVVPPPPPPFPEATQ